MVFRTKRIIELCGASQLTFRLQLDDRVVGPNEFVQ